MTHKNAPEMIVGIDYGSRDRLVALLAAHMTGDGVLILDVCEVDTTSPAIESACFENAASKPMKHEPWYRKFDKRKQR